MLSLILSTENTFTMLIEGSGSFNLICLVFIAILLLLNYIRNVLNERQRLSKELPGMEIGYFNIWGDLKEFQKKKTEFSDYGNAYMLQSFREYTELFREEQFFCFWASVKPLVFAVKAQAVEELIGTTKHLEKSWTYRWVRLWLQTGLLTSKGQKWKSRRKLIAPSFHFDILKDFLPVINEQSRYLIKLFKKETKEDWTDVAHPLTLCTLDVICETTLGVKINAQKDSKSEYVQSLIRSSSTVMKRLSSPLYFADFTFNLTSLGRQYNKDVKVLHDFTRAVCVMNNWYDIQGPEVVDIKVIKKKKAEALNGNNNTTANKKRKALMDTLLEHHLKDKTLSEADICEEVDTFTFAGHDTTAMGISWALYLIGLHRDVQICIQEELDRIFGDDIERPVAEEDLKDMAYLECVIKESLRLYPSAPIIGRQSTADTVLNGQKIPEGVACLVYIYELHRDPEQFPDPERFDPNRFLPENCHGRHPYAYIPFSAGPRNCVGQRFAMMEEKVILANILRNYTVESLEPRDKVLPAPEVVLRNSKPLKIKIRERMR